jgi:hypothetical protein
LKWRKEVGIIFPKIEYPAVFEDNLIGMRAREPIKHKEMILAAPYKVLLSNEKAKSDPSIGIIFEENKDFFGRDNEVTASSNCIMVVHMLHEYQKGKNSFWHPFLDNIPEANFFDYWDKKALLET